MKRAHGNRVWRGMVLAAAIGAVAVLAISSLAAARGGHGGESHRHGPDTGTIASFDQATGVLEIQLSNGGNTVAGVVSRRTKIKCEDERSPDASLRAREGESGGNSGPGGGSGEAEPGDDHGDYAVEPGDDNGGANEPGDDRGGRGPSGHDDNGVGANCPSSDLIVGATVHEAELDLRGGKAVWDEVELAPAVI